MKQKSFFLLLLGLSLVFTGCWEKEKLPALLPQESVGLTQVSTINALLAGAYDGQMTCEKLLSYGNFGLGAFDKLDGEMLVLDRKIYQVKADGKVYHPPLSEKTPFASVVAFRPEKTMPLAPQTSFEKFTAEMNQALPNQNILYAFKIRGNFSKVKTRSVPTQNKPYPPLSEVTKTQPVFERENVSGTMIGFRAPDYMKTLTVPGYHLHFISDDETFGGHVLDFIADSGTIETEAIYQFSLILPQEDSSFAQMNLSPDRSAELKSVESEH